MKVIDTHSHLNMPEFKKDVEEVIARAKEAGLIACIVVGINPSTNKKALELAEKWQGYIFPVVGFHPHEVRLIKEENYEELELQAEDSVAIGEIGLDWVKEYSPRDVQIENFEKQLDLAKKLGKPVVLHLRGDSQMWKTAMSILKNFFPVNFVAHCFTGDKELAKKILDMGGKVSIPGIVTFPKATELQETVKFLPLDSFFVETDCPFLTPVPMRGKRNEPAYVIYTVKKIAELKNTSEEEIADTTTKNAIKFFNLPIKVE